MDSSTRDPNAQALVRKRTDTDLMPPPPPAKKVKRPRKILDEDTYTESLSRIIARDFFPGLLETEIQQEYLDAVESKDSAWISSASHRLRCVMTPGRSPAATKDTPKPTPSSSSLSLSLSSSLNTAKPPRVDTTLSLTAFQSTYTSEDNESFYKVIDRQNQQRADKYAWLWRGNRLPSKMELKQKEVRAQLGNQAPLAIEDSDDRPAMPDTWKFQPNNQLMFVPDGVLQQGDAMHTQRQAASGVTPPQVVHANTRIQEPETTTPEESVPASPSLSAIRDAINSKRRPEYDETSAGGGETPRVNGYAFVEDEEPEAPPRPKSNPIDLGPGDSAPNPFELHESSKRETLHRKMVDRISESKRTSVRLGMTGKNSLRMTPTPGKYAMTPRASASLTPAAQRLWNNIGGGSTPTRTLQRMHSPSTPVRKPARRPQ